MYLRKISLLVLLSISTLAQTLGDEEFSCWDVPAGMKWPQSFQGALRLGKQNQGDIFKCGSLPFTSRNNCRLYNRVYSTSESSCINSEISPHRNYLPGTYGVASTGEVDFSYRSELFVPANWAGELGRIGSNWILLWDHLAFGDIENPDCVGYYAAQSDQISLEFGNPVRRPCDSGSLPISCSDPVQTSDNIACLPPAGIDDYPRRIGGLAPVPIPNARLVTGPAGPVMGFGDPDARIELSWLPACSATNSPEGIPPIMGYRVEVLVDRTPDGDPGLPYACDTENKKYQPLFDIAPVPHTGDQIPDFFGDENSTALAVRIADYIGQGEIFEEPYGIESLTFRTRILFADDRLRVQGDGGFNSRIDPVLSLPSAPGLSLFTPRPCTDADGDGFSPAGAFPCQAGNPIDCDDADSSTYPGAIETDDGTDNDCDGYIDEISVEMACEVQPSNLSVHSQSSLLSFKVKVTDRITGEDLDAGVLSPAFLSRIHSPSLGNISLPKPRAEKGCRNELEDGIWESVSHRTVAEGGQGVLRFDNPSDGNCETADGDLQDLLKMFRNVEEGEIVTLCIQSTYPGAPEPVECCGEAMIASTLAPQSSDPAGFPGPLELLFSHPVFSTGDTPAVLVTGDFNKDGMTDVAVANTRSRDVSILLGLGNGLLDDEIRIPDIPYPYSMLVEDFNLDGNIDLIIDSSQEFIFLKGNGDGSFEKIKDSGIEDSYNSRLFLGEFNDDGIADLAGYDPSSGNIILFHGNGDGSFEIGQELPLRDEFPSFRFYFYTLAQGDFNFDERTDLAVAIEDRYSTQNLIIFLGEGDQKFSAPIRIESGSYNQTPRYLSAADFNRDGFDDLIGRNYRNEITLFISLGNGQFEQSRPFGDTRFVKTTVSDFNQDGYPDLVAHSGSTTIDFFKGLGNSDFDLEKQIPIQRNDFAFATGDFDNDSQTDLAVANRELNHVVLHRSDAVVSASRIQMDSAVGTGALLLDDFNADGFDDLLALRNEIVIFPGLSEGLFGPGSPVPTPYRARGGITVDLNSDGYRDILFAQSGLVYLPGRGDGNFDPGSHFSLGNGMITSNLAIADFNQDGNLDISAAGGAIMFIPGFDDGNFLDCPYCGPHFRFFSELSPSSQLTHDFDRDNNPDLVIGQYSRDSISVLFGEDGFRFRTGPLQPAGPRPSQLMGKDFNKDGILDLAVTNRLYSGPDLISILIGRGQGLFDPPDSYPAGKYPSSLATGDFNADGYQDLVFINSGWYSSSPGTFTIIPSLKNGTFGSPVSFVAGGKPYSLAVGDFNFDGWDDLAVSSSQPRDLLLLMNLGPEVVFPVTLAFLADSCPEMYPMKGQGRTWLAVVGTKSLDLQTVEPDSIRIFGMAPRKIDFEDAGGLQPGTGCMDGEADGRIDLVLAIDEQDLLAAIESSASAAPGTTSDVTLSITGRLRPEFGGGRITGRMEVAMPEVATKKGRR